MGNSLKKMPYWLRLTIGIILTIILVIINWQLDDEKQDDAATVATVQTEVNQAEIGKTDVDEVKVSQVDTSQTEDSKSEVVQAEVGQVETSQIEDTKPDASQESAKEVTSYYFRSKKLLNQHYEKHGVEMGFADAKEYEAAASAVVNNPAALHKLEAEDGDDIYYVEDTNEFVVVSTDGYLRTYFWPSGGKKYYDKQ